LEPVFGCNYRCFFCLHASLPAVKPVVLTPFVFERLKPILDKVSHVHLTGMGEPFLNPHLGEYLAYFREKGIKYYINSNGSLIQDGHMQLLLTSQSELSISLDAADKQTYQKIRHPDNWDKVIGVIRRISQLRKCYPSRFPLLYLSYHINQLNLASLKNLPDLCREFGIDAVKLSWTILPETKKELSPFKDLAGAARLIRNVALTLRRQGVAIRDEVLFQPHERGCWNLTEFTFLAANGQVAACCSRWLTIGDLLANGFEDIWNGQPHRRICFGVLNHQPVASCESCRQLQAVDYRINAGAFIKNHKADETLLF
jgi:wyosine [tRNA(Phe)-imidazoG37] synthetase (radical SAM superfamily)